jgi:hypothetical protein
MSFPRHGQIYRWPLAKTLEAKPLQLRPQCHRIDEFATGYSLAGCSPAEPASASPAGFIFIPPAETVNRHHQLGGGFFNRQNAEFSVGIDSRKE